jgi:hypothetical protein
LPVSGRVRCAVFDVAGQRVATLADRVEAPGRHELVWSGLGLKPGTYLVRASVAGQIRSVRIVKAD